jgi:penicillin-binding protein 1C
MLFEDNKTPARSCMKVVIQTLFLFLSVLIKIGDWVLLFLAFIGKTVELVATSIAKAIARVFGPVFVLGKNIVLSILAVFATLFQTIGIIVLVPFSLFGRSRKKPTVKHKKASPVVIYPLPFLLRFKYFIVGVIFSLLFIFFPLLIVVFLQDLPNPKMLSMGQIPQTTKIYDRNGTLLYQIYASQNRTLVPLDTVPKTLQQATIAIEDKDFYNHIGFDVTAIIRSALKNASGTSIQGGSTLTQQLIKSSLLTSETSLQRKLKEVILAFWAERMYTKKQILELYFNQIPYGGTAWGVEAASEIYFGKNVQDVDLAESAFLAGIPQSPTVYSPYGTSPNAWKNRQKEVLKRMRELGYITSDQEHQALEEELTFKAPQTPIYAPHFVMYVKDFLVKKYGLPMVEKGGLTVTTSLDLKLQDTVQKIVSDEVAGSSYLNLSNGAALVTNPANGDILAMVGSHDFSDPDGGNVNLTTALRQPGSSIKIVTYTAALSSGNFTAATPLDDSPITFPSNPPYSPVNYDGRSHGRVPLRIAFANSFNITAVKTLNQVGVDTFVNYGKRLGIKSWGSPDKYGLSITLGAAEAPMVDMATVYGTFANSGVRVDLNPVVKITDYKGTVLEEKKSDEETLATAGHRVLDSGVAFIVSDILADNPARSIEFGTNSPLNIPGKRVSVKTGTSDNKRDNWTIGYTKDYVVTVWVGNNNNAPMSQTLASGITGAAPIWNKVMNNLLATKYTPLVRIPENVIPKQCGGRIEYFIKGTENRNECNYKYNAPSGTPSPTPGH